MIELALAAVTDCTVEEVEDVRMPGKVSLGGIRRCTQCCDHVFSRCLEPSERGRSETVISESTIAIQSPS